MPLANFIPTANDYIRYLPEIILTLAGTLVMVLEAALGDRKKPVLGWLTLAGLLGAIWGACAALGVGGYGFQDMVVADGLAAFFRVLVIGIGVLTLFASMPYLERERANPAEYYALLLFSVAGQSVMVSANELVMVFIGLEISSISSYILAGYLREDRRNNEAALKYFLLGSFATAFLLYGVAWIYGLTGSTNLIDIREALTHPAAGQDLTLVGTAAALMLVGLLFKVSAAPFQMWAPDVYQGAPAPVSGFMSTAPKAAAFAVLFRIFIVAFGAIGGRWEPLIWVVAIATMVVGNFAALTQTNIKRLLAYSSIAHAGYLLVALAAHSEIGTAAAMFYLAAYGLMQVGAFAVVAWFSRQSERFVAIEDLAGLGRRDPVPAAMMTIFLLSLIGVPLTAGFFGKFYIFRAALDSNLRWLTVIGLLNSAVAAYYYLRIIVVMYFREPARDAEPLDPVPTGLRVAILGSVLGTLLLGIAPSALLEFASKSATLAK